MKINIVCRTYIKDFLKIFLILLLSMSLLLSIVGLVEKIDDFMPYNPSIIFFVEFILYSLPRYIFYLIPFITLVTSLFVFSMGVRSREFLILSVSGGKLREILKPFLVLGVIISILGFIFGEFIQPEFIKKLNIMIEELTQKGKVYVKKDLFVRDKDGTVIKIGSFFQEQKRAEEVKIFVIKNDILVKRIDAQQVEIGQKDWILKKCTVYDFSTGKVEKYDLMSYPVSIKISIAAFKDIKKIEEFGISELIQKRKELKKAGLSNPKIDTDISSRLSYNFVTFFMMVLGISLPLGAHERFIFLFSRAKTGAISGGIITFGIGLVITIFYWLLYSLFMFMGYSKILPSFVSPWITPLIFGFVSIKLYYSIKQ
ncbi:MAG: LptF/LptG family permease [Thermodesulfovibrio sp.]|nr:LptF/LptG family permease [Thermodesulfovibrio sp.]MDW7972260.1 LptF/LptG family permease [Thermodesulfovibrio sp.]